MQDYKNLPKRTKRTDRKPRSLMPGFIVTAIYAALISLAIGYVLWGGHHA